MDRSRLVESRYCKILVKRGSHLVKCGYCEVLWSLIAVPKIRLKLQGLKYLQTNPQNMIIIGKYIIF